MITGVIIFFVYKISPSMLTVCTIEMKNIPFQQCTGVFNIKTRTEANGFSGQCFSSP